MSMRIGIQKGRLSSCPPRPNCVCSDDSDETHRIEPFRLTRDPQAAWNALLKEIASRPRTRIVTAEKEYLHAEERSRLFGFVDDIEFHLRPPEAIIAVRSASRTGRSDLGVNRKRVEEIRRTLQQQGVLR